VKHIKSLRENNWIYKVTISKRGKPKFKKLKKYFWLIMNKIINSDFTVQPYKYSDTFNIFNSIKASLVEY
jgi:hypothetical protein